MALNLGPLNVLLQLKGERKFNQGMSGASRNLLAMGAAGTAAALVVRKIAVEIIEATQVFAEFERSMVRVGAVTNSLGSQAFAGLTERAQELATTTEFTARQVADAMGFMGMAGMSTNKIFESTPAVLQLASAGMVDVATAADTVTNIMAGYGVQAEDLEKTNNILVATFTNSNTSLQSLGQSFKYVGPVAKSAGIEFREAAAVIGLMGNAGIQADMAGTALRGTLIKLLDPTAEGAKIMRQYGINVVDATGKLKPMVEIFRQLEPIADDSAKMIELFGLRAGPGMQAALSQGTEALERLIGKIDGAGNIAERISKAQLDTLDGKIKILKSNFEGLQIAIGEAFAPAATVAVELVSGYLSDATKAAQDLKAAIDGTTGSITEFGSEANIAMRNYIRAMGAVLGLDFGAVEPVIGSPKNVEAISVELEKQKALKEKLGTLGQKNAFEVKQYGVASNAVTEEIKRTLEALTLSQERVKALGAEMRRASVPAKQLAKATVYPDLAQDPAFARRGGGARPSVAEAPLSAMDFVAGVFEDLPVFVGTTAMSLEEFNELIDNGSEIIIDHSEALQKSTETALSLSSQQQRAAYEMQALASDISYFGGGVAGAMSGGSLGQTFGPQLAQGIGAAIGAAFGAPQVGGAVGNVIGQIFGPMFDTVAQAVDVFAPLVDVVNELAVDVFLPFVVALRPAIEIFAERIKSISWLFEGLGIVLGVMQWATSQAQVALQNIINWAQNLFLSEEDKIPMIAHQSLQSYLDELDDARRQALEDLNGETHDAAENFRQLNEELSNVPIGVKRLRAIQYGATRGATPFPSLFSQPAFGA